MSISEVVRKVGVNESSITRLANRRGLRGYPAVVELCRANAVLRSDFRNRFERLEDTASPLKDAASPLKRLSDLTLHVRAEVASILRSLTALISFSQALVGEVARHLGTTSTRSSLLIQEDLLGKFETYCEIS